MKKSKDERVEIVGRIADLSEALLELNSRRYQRIASRGREAAA